MPTRVAVAVSPSTRRHRGRVFCPTDIGGCILWLPADLPAVTFEAPADACARWLDRSVNRYDVAQTTAAKRPTVSGALLSFDLASVQTLQRPMLSEIDAGAYTIGTAQRFRQVVSQQCVYANALAGGSAGIYVTSNPNRYVTHTNVSGVSWGANTTNPETWIARHNGAGGQADFCLNGAHLTPQAMGQSLAGTGTFDIAAYVGAVFPSDIDLYAIVVYSDRKSDAVVDQLSAYLTALRNGVAPPVGWAPSDETNLVLWLERPDLYAAHPINTWWDQSGSGHDATQVVAADQPAWSAAGGYNGRPGVGFDVTNTEFMNITGMADASNSYTVIASYNMRTMVAGGVAQTLLGAGIPNLGWLAKNYATGDVGLNDGLAWIALGAANAGSQVVAWRTKSTVPSVEAFRDGAPIGSAAFDGSLEIGPNAYLGTQGTPNYFFDGTLTELVVYNTALSDANLNTVTASML